MRNAESSSRVSIEHARAKLLTGLGSLVVICAVLTPMAENWSDDPRDDFPLSYYPMFTKLRADTTSIVHVVGFDERGQAYRVGYKLVGSGGMNQVRKQIRRQLKAGRADDLCRTVAKRMSGKKSRSTAAISTVAIVTSRYELDEYMFGDRSPLRQRVEASCRVK